MKPSFCSLSVAAVAAFVACSDAFKPTAENVIGDYTARWFTVTTDTGGTRNLLAEGAVFVISLTHADTTFGYLYVAGGGNNGADLIDSMQGTWTLTGNEVHFAQSGDTFVRDMTFIAGDHQLTGDETFGTVRVRVVLRK